MRKNNIEYEFLGLLGKFITEYLPVSMNASPNTILSYKCAFRLLFQFLEENTEIKTGHITFEMLNFDLLTNFFDWLVTVRKNSRTTTKQRMGALASFAEYAQCRNLDAGCVFRSSLTRIAKKSFRRVQGKNAVLLPVRSWRSFFHSKIRRKSSAGVILSCYLSCM